jgi:tRNA(fMet)-specific endonuclease VapC
MDRVVAEHYSELIEFCISQGKPRAASDLIIAATARAMDAALVSYDRRARFEELPNLRIIN